MIKCMKCAYPSDRAMLRAQGDMKGDNINNPAHYKANGIEAIDVIEAFELNFRLANVVKYVLRAGKKGDKREDLEKAKWYLEREIDARQD